MGYISRIVAIPLFLTIGRDILRKTGRVLRENNLHYPKVLLLTGDNTSRDAARRIGDSLQALKTRIRVEKVYSSQREETDRIRTFFREEKFPLVLGVGGGQVLDVGKFVSFVEGADFISIPTVASHDGIASPVAVIRKDRKNQSIHTRMPLGVILDIEMIEKAPLRYLRAGVGDLMANLSSTRDWILAQEIGLDSVDSFAVLLAQTASISLLFFPRPDFGDDRFLETFLNGLTLSGIAMGIAGSSKPCSGSEHKISHSLDHLFPERALHGEQVGLATIFSLYLHRDPLGARVKDLYRRLGCALIPEEIGFSREEFAEAIAYARNIRPERHTILESTELEKDEILRILDELYPS